MTASAAAVDASAPAVDTAASVVAVTFVALQEN